MLLRIRTELKQTMMSYQELFEKSIVWGRQKMVESEQGWERLVTRRDELLEEVAQLARVKRSWQTEVDVVTKNMEDLHQEQLKEQVKVFHCTGNTTRFFLFSGNAKLQPCQ